MYQTIQTLLSTEINLQWYLGGCLEIIMKRSHNGSTYPADKQIPEATLKNNTPVQRKLQKKRHKKKSRQYQEKSNEN